MRRRNERMLRAFGKITAGICWGAALKLSGASFEMIVWFVVAAICLTGAGHIAFGRLGSFFSGELGLPMIGLVIVGLILGIWFADLIPAVQRH